MEKTIHRIVTLKELYDRWRRNKYWLDDFCLRDGIEVYVVNFKTSHEDINRGRILDYYVIGGYSPGIFERSDVVFARDDVERIEKEHPEVIAPPPPPVPPCFPRQE